MVRAIGLALVVALVVGFAGQTQAADGNLSSALLADMGLGGLQVMTDAQGETIRGQGFAAVFGVGKAQVGRTKEVNGYIAASDNPEGAFAIGGNIAVAKKGGVSGGGIGGVPNGQNSGNHQPRPRIRVRSWAVAGGVSAAYAN